MKRYRELANLSVARACGFAGLAILCVMVGLASDLANSLKAGGYGCLLSTAVLLIKARTAPSRPVKRTELWMLLDKSERPPEAIAQPMLGGLLRRTYLRYAAIHAAGAGGMLGLALAITLFRALAG